MPGTKDTVELAKGKAAKPAKPAKPKPQPVAVTVADALYPVAAIADLVGIGAERIRQLCKIGYIAKAARNQVWLRSGVQGYIRSLKDDLANNTKSASAAALQDAKRAEIEQRMAEAQRNLVPTEDADAFVDEVEGAWVAKLVSLPAAYTRNLDERRRLETHCDAIRAEMAQMLRERKAVLRSRDPADPADDEA